MFWESDISTEWKFYTTEPIYRPSVTESRSFPFWKHSPEGSTFHKKAPAIPLPATLLEKEVFNFTKLSEQLFNRTHVICSHSYRSSAESCAHVYSNNYP